MSERLMMAASVKDGIRLGRRHVARTGQVGLTDLVADGVKGCPNALLVVERRVQRLTQIELAKRLGTVQTEISDRAAAEDAHARDLRRVSAAARHRSTPRPRRKALDPARPAGVVGSLSR